MNTECLEQLVGLDECDSTHAFSLNSIGLSKNQVEEFLDDSYANAQALVNAMKRQAARQVVSDAFGSLPTGVKVNGTIETGTAGIFGDNLQIRTGGQWRGIRIETRNSNEYVGININAVSLLVAHTGAIPVNVVNLTTGQTIGSVTINAVAGQIVRVPCQITAYSSAQNIRLAVIYNAATINSYATTIHNNGCTNCSGGPAWTSRRLTIAGITASAPFTRAQTQLVQHTGGMALEYSITCAPELWLCSLQHLLGTAMQYGTAMMLLNYGLNSGDQFSHQKTTNLEGNKERLEFCQFQYQEHLKRAMMAAKYPIGACFECAGRVQAYNILPG